MKAKRKMSDMLQLLANFVGRLVRRLRPCRRLRLDRERLLLVVMKCHGETWVWIYAPEQEAAVHESAARMGLDPELSFSLVDVAVLDEIIETRKCEGQ